MSDNAPVLIADLGLPKETANVLKRVGITTLEELISKSYDELHIGYRNTWLVRRFLGYHGLSLKGELAPTGGRIHLEDTSLSFKTKNRLYEEGGIAFAEEIANLSAGELREIPNIGPATLREIRLAIAEYGLSLKGESVYEESAYELDEIAKALKKAGRPGIVAKAGKDGNSFLLQMEHDGEQLELRRPPAGSKWNALDTLKQLDSLGRSVLYLPDVLEHLSGFAWELNVRSRIKSILTIKRLATMDERFQVRELTLEAGESKGISAHELGDCTYTGRHWILVAVPGQVSFT